LFILISVITAIAAERPLRDTQEARMAAYKVNNIMAFVEYGLLNDAGWPNNQEAVFEGLREIIHACRLVPLRVEQSIY